MAQVQWMYGLAWRLAAWAAVALAPLSTARAQDAARGAGLYLQLPGAMASCVSCHGPDPAANRNNLLRAAGQPTILLKALNSIGVMGYLKEALSDADVADLASYLDTVARAGADSGRSVWPRSIEFGALAVGTASPEHAVWLRNLSALPLDGVAPRLVGGHFALRHDCPVLLAPGAACSVQVLALAPAAGEAVSDALVWGPASAAVVGLSARGTGASVGRLSIDSAVVDFGTAEVGGAAARRVNLLNSGTADVTLGVATFTGPTASAFSSDGGCTAGTVLLPGTACAVELRWRAAAAVAYEASLQWRSDGGNPAPLRLLAAGTAASSPRVAPVAPPMGDEGSGGGCAAAPAGVRGDFGLALWALLAAAALQSRRGQRRKR